MHGMTDEDRMFSVRVAPWHFGETNSVVLPDHPLPELVLEAAGLDWTVGVADVYRKLEPDYVSRHIGTFPKLPGWKMLVREDTQSILHVAKDTYEPIQNAVGAELMELLLESDSAVKYETGGSIGGGATCYLAARVDEPVVIDGDDSPTFPYVVVTWSHDGSAAMQARSTNVRVVCWNTLSFSEAQARRAGRNFTFRHTKNVAARIEEAKRTIQGVREDSISFTELANELAAIGVSDDMREQFVTTFVPKPEAEVISDRVLDNILTARQQVRSTFNSPSIPEAHRNTAYGLVLAGTEYLDHLRGFRNSDTYLGRTLLKDEALKARLVPMVRKLVGADA